METVVEAGPGEGGGARLIESCTCPTGYSGLSCQECSSGFFQQPLSELSSQSRRSLFIRPCVQCRCNNHSETCDPETGACQGGFGDFRCSACHTGFEGRYCERCSVGYYGNPSLPGGVCVLCGCSDWGAESQLCDAAGGQCECKAGVTGRSCDLCEERHVLQEGACVSCDDECTGMLLDDLQEVHDHFLSVNLSALAAAPYRQLVLLENRTRDLRDRLRLLTSDLTALLQQVPRLSDQLKEVGVSTNKSLSQGALLLESISNLQGSIQELQRETGLLNLTSVEQLDSANQTQLLQEMAAMLENIRAVNLTGANALANQELSMASLDNRLRLLHTNFTVKQQQVGGGVASVEGVMEESQLMLDDIISLTEEMTNSSAVEVWGGQLEQVRPLLRRQVEALVVGLKMLDALENVFRAESHADFLQTHAHSLHSLLYSVCNVSHNGSRLVQLDSDITHRVDSAHQVASAALAVSKTVQSEQLQNTSSLRVSTEVLQETVHLNKTAAGKSPG
ncbi:hypothetical protein JOQ06_028102 [Pogonophryne albipinna]|uniref:Laminin EGF-like domain-containing protein n=1 Tax=Pogonophryne albipinna TaxID=1090488 RepID=A0AAD6F7R2_9TELE|nr:hypothetical protein JOQ06_028102 [Pogonophryne albipinna]